MHFSSLALCSWLLATLPPQVLGVQKIRHGFTRSGGVAKNSPLVDLDFGGTEHGVDSQGDNMRPEAVKMEVCQEPLSKCSECKKQASCWRGATGSVESNALTSEGIDIKQEGALRLDVSASAKDNYYAANMWATCGSGNGKWQVVVWRDSIVNGVLKIFVDGKLGLTVDGSEEDKHPKLTGKDIAKNTRVRVLFERSTAGKAASAQVKLKAGKVDEYVDKCMGVTNCLQSLGDGSKSAFTFRNSNKLQLKCLKAKTKKRDAVSDHCNVFATCVSSSGVTSKLVALLGAAITPHGSLAEGKTYMQKLNDAEGCVDPSVEDPESWDCECMDEMTQSCMPDGASEECFAKILCKNTNVCESWKGAHCAEALLAKHKISTQASQNISAALASRVTISAIATVDDRLDTALSGKCSQ